MANDKWNFETFFKNNEEILMIEEEKKKCTSFINCEDVWVRLFPSWLFVQLIKLSFPD